MKLQHHIQIIATLIALSSCGWTGGGAVVVDTYEVSIPSVELEETDSQLAINIDGTLSLDGVPYDGYLISHDAEGRLKSRRGYLDGRLEGDWFTYFPNGEMETTRGYRRGERHGKHYGYYANGQMKFYYYFENGLAQSLHNTWYPDGSLSTELNFLDGQEFGTQKVWRSDGKLRSNYVVRENGRRYGMIGLKRCTKIDSETEEIDPYLGMIQ